MSSRWRRGIARKHAARIFAYLTKVRRIGIVARLSASFVAVSVLAIAANYWAAHSYVKETTRIERPVIIMTPPPSPFPLALSAASDRAAGLEHAMPKQSEAALDYSRALQQFFATVMTRTSAEDAQVDGMFRTARATLARSATRLANEVVESDKSLAARLKTGAAQSIEGAQSLLDQSDERRRMMREYRRHLDQLTQNINNTLDGSFKIFGRLIAREYLLKLDASLQGIRGRMDDAIASNVTPLSLQALAASEREFAVTLEANRSSLRRVQGSDWVGTTDNQLSVLSGLRESLQRGHDAYESSYARFAQSVTDAAVVAAQCVVPAAALQRLETSRQQKAAPMLDDGTSRSLGSGAAVGVPDEATPEVVTTTVAESDQGHTTLIARITIAVILLVFVISLLTVLSVVRPVRRLVKAAARLAAGDSAISVERGGIKELDQLAGSFNEMARHLQSASDASRSYQARLEAEVAGRTEELRELAERDSLTQLPNRRFGLLLMERALEAARSRGAYVGVFFIDLDNFKSINDTLGHAFGDKVLASVAERLRRVCAPHGHATRLGGDEFSIIHFGAASPEEIHEAAAQLVRTFHESFSLEQRELLVSISCGVSVFPLDGHSCADLLSCADAALYRAKSLGRNQSSIYSADLLALVSENFSIEQRLRRAIERDELELVFQPEVGVESLRVELVEALVRWRQPDGRLAPPGEFLSIAEASGFIADIDEWVMRAAIEAVAAWRGSEWPDARVAINVSSRRLLDPTFVDRLQELLALHRLPAQCLEIELTETVLQTGAANIRTLHALKAAGFAIGLDDFGTGYSSLTSLAQLPLTRVKLDRSLIASTDERSIAIALTTLSLCKQLELEVTAEGIETPEQLARLFNHESVHLQGYLISHPLRFGDVPAALASIPRRMALHVLDAKLVKSSQPAKVSAPVRLSVGR